MKTTKNVVLNVESKEQAKEQRKKSVLKLFRNYSKGKVYLTDDGLNLLQKWVKQL
jgi:hypothetical protein